MVIFLYNLDIFVWIQHRCLADMVFTGSQQPCYKAVMVYSFFTLADRQTDRQTDSEIEGKRERLIFTCGKQCELDHDQMPHNVASDLCLYYLFRPAYPNT